MTIVQRTPNLGLTLRMQRNSKPASTGSSEGGGGGESEVLGAGWLVPAILDFSAFQDSSLLEDGRWEITAGSPQGYTPVASIWEGTPDFVDPDGEAWPRPGPGFRCTEITVDSTYYTGWPGWTFFGVLQATGLVDAHWLLEWSSPSSTDPLISSRGHRARTYANVVQVELYPTDTSAAGAETLTATALSGGEVVAVLKLTATSIAA